MSLRQVGIHKPLHKSVIQAALFPGDGAQTRVDRWGELAYASIARALQDRIGKLVKECLHNLAQLLASVLQELDVLELFVWLYLETGIRCVGLLSQPPGVLLLRRTFDSGGIIGDQQVVQRPKHLDHLLGGGLVLHLPRRGGRLSRSCRIARTLCHGRLPRIWKLSGLHGPAWRERHQVHSWMC